MQKWIHLEVWFSKLIDQKNILILSRMYDNVQESLDCPADDIMQDDDMLDGWFIHQKNKK